MPDPAHRLSALRRMPRVWRQAAIAAALGSCGPEEASVFAAALIEEAVQARAAGRSLVGRARRVDWREAIAGVLRNWRKLDAAARAGALACIGGDLAVVLRGLAGSARPQDRAAAGWIAAEMPAPVALELAGRLVLDVDDAVAGAGEEALLGAALAMDRLTPEALEALDTALVDVARAYGEHRRKRVMLAVAHAADRPGKRLLAWLHDDDQPGHMALRAVVRQSTDAAGRARCVRWLSVPSLAGAALERLQSPATAEAHEAALRVARLLLHPARRSHVARLDRSRGVLPRFEDAEKMPPDARLGRLHWLSALALPAPKLVEQAVACLTDLVPEVRHGAVRLLARHSGDAQARGALCDYAFDVDARVGRTAALAASGPGGWPGDSPLRRLRRSPHEALRRLAAANDAGDPWATLERDDRMDHAAGARAELTRDRPGFIAGLRAAVSGGDGQRRLRAIRLAARLGLADEVELELLRCLAEGDARLCAAAVGALGGAKSASAWDAVQRCLDHTDPRVRATAVERVGVRRPDHARLLAAMRDDHARSRANAVRIRLVVARDGGAERELAEMLGDDRAEHRVSALWVTERTGRSALAERVAALARPDNPGPDRECARRCARRLLAQMRAAWADGPAGASRRSPLEAST